MMMSFSSSSGGCVEGFVFANTESGQHRQSLSISWSSVPSQFYPLLHLCRFSKAHFKDHLLPLFKADIDRERDAAGTISCYLGKQIYLWEIHICYRQKKHKVKTWEPARHCGTGAGHRPGLFFHRKLSACGRHHHRWVCNPGTNCLHTLFWQFIFEFLKSPCVNRSKAAHRLWYHPPCCSSHRLSKGWFYFDARPPGDEGACQHHATRFQHSWSVTNLNFSWLHYLTTHSCRLATLNVLNVSVNW